MTVKDCLKKMSKTASYTVKHGRKNYLCNYFECLVYFGNMRLKKVAYPNYADGSNNEELPILYI